MALQKQIPKPDGVVPEYWRVGVVAIDALSPGARIVLVGYVSAAKRGESAQYVVDQREYVLGPPQFAALAASDAAGPSTFAAIATPCYQFIKDTRRPCEIDPDTGEGLLQTGERFPAEQVVMVGDQPTIPSEFADALDV